MQNAYFQDPAWLQEDRRQIRTPVLKNKQTRNGCQFSRTHNQFSTVEVYTVESQRLPGGFGIVVSDSGVVVIAIAQYIVRYIGPADEQAGATANDGLFDRANFPKKLGNSLVASSR